MGSKQLFEVVRQVVREEVARALPEMIRHHLTEAYLRRVVSEESRRPAHRPVVSELTSLVPDVDEEEVPEPQPNGDMGIYNPNTFIKEARRSAPPSKLTAGENPLAFVYESVNVAEEPPAPKPLPIKNSDFAQMNELVKSMNELASAKKNPVDPETRLREIEMRRKELDSRRA